MNERNNLGKARTLNQVCAFGNHTTRFYSNLGEAPDFIESKESNLLIMNVLNKFAAEVEKSEVKLLKIPLDHYDVFAAKSNLLESHTPSSLKEIFPIPKERNVDYIYENKVKNHNSTIAKVLCREFEAENNSKASKKKKVKHILGLLQDNFGDYLNNNGKVLNLVKNENKKYALKQGEGVVISYEDFEVLKNFQDLQERFENVENIIELNSFPKIKEIMELILGIQKCMLDVLEKVKITDTEWFNSNSIAFLEIAFEDENKKLVLSSRFLKLILHNIGEYLLKHKDEKSEAICLLESTKDALRDDVFHQKISLFQNTEEGIRFDGIVDKVCPARTAISKIMQVLLEKYISNTI